MNIHRIRADITTARNNLSHEGNPTNDEYLYDVAAYHAQQAVEKTLKYFLHNVYGVDDTSKQFKTHNISTLLIMINSHDANFISNHQKLADLSDEITSWEASTRYGENLVATKNTIIEVLDYCESIISNEIQSEVTKDNDQTSLNETNFRNPSTTDKSKDIIEQSNTNTSSLIEQFRKLKQHTQVLLTKSNSSISEHKQEIERLSEVNPISNQRNQQTR